MKHTNFSLMVLKIYFPKLNFNIFCEDDVEHFLLVGYVVVCLSIFYHHVINIVLYNIPIQFKEDFIHYPLIICLTFFKLNGMTV